jgi:hypothetical protein
MFKSFILLTTLFGVQIASAQFYIRTKKNIGVYSSYNFGQDRLMQPSVNIGLFTQIGKHFIPELGANFVSIDQEAAFRSLNAGLQYRTRLLKINERKRGAKCKMEILDLFAAPEYFYTPNESHRLEKNTYAMRYGIALHHFETGGFKRSRAWLTKIEAYHRTYFGYENPKRREFGIALRIQFFKTYDFLR